MLYTHSELFSGTELCCVPAAKVMKDLAAKLERQ